MERYGGLIWSLAVRVLTREEAEDAVQEVLIELWRHAARFDVRRASEKTFVAMIARRRIIDRRRTRKRDAMADRIEPSDVVSQDHRRMEVSTDVALAAQVMQELPAERLRVVRMSVVEGLTHSEIATETGLPIGTVKSHLRRGLALVRERLLGGAGQKRRAAT